jgi:chaperonin cofactor prefoldin
VSEELFRELKKLFITTKKVPVSITELSPSIRDQLEMIRNDKLYFEKLISRKDIVTAQLADIIRVHPENKYEISVGSIKVPKENIYASNILDEVMNAGSIIDTDISIIDIVDDDINIIDVIDEKEINADIGSGHIAIDKDKLEDNINTRDTTTNVDKETVNRVVRNYATPQPVMKSASATNATGIKKEVPVISAANAARIATAVSKSSGYSMSMMQPHGAKISASLSTKFDGYQRNYDLLKAQKAFYFRQSLKMERKYEKLSNKWVEEPGLIPKTLDELHGVLKNVRTEEQPRIDILLDNVNVILEEAKGTVTKANETMDSVKDALSIVDEAKETVTKANETMDSVKNALSILDFDTKYVKLGAMVIGGLIIINLFIGMIVLIRMALGF